VVAAGRGVQASVWFRPVRLRRCVLQYAELNASLRVCPWGAPRLRGVSAEQTRERERCRVGTRPSAALSGAARYTRSGAAPSGPGLRSRSVLAGDADHVRHPPELHPAPMQLHSPHRGGRAGRHQTQAHQRLKRGQADATIRTFVRTRWGRWYLAAPESPGRRHTDSSVPHGRPFRRARCPSHRGQYASGQPFSSNPPGRSLARRKTRGQVESMGAALLHRSLGRASP